jgi:hypothetical protein
MSPAVIALILAPLIPLSWFGGRLFWRYMLPKMTRAGAVVSVVTFPLFGAGFCYVVVSSLLDGSVPCLGHRGCGVEYTLANEARDFWTALGGWYAAAWGFLSYGVGSFITLVSGPVQRP